MSAVAGGGLFQNSVYVAINLENILYGVELVLYFQTMHSLLNHAGQRTKSDIFYAIFSSGMLLMITIWVSALTIFCGKMWLLDSSFPSNQQAFWAATTSVWYMDLSTTAIIVLQLMTDALMIYRCWALWNSYCAIIVPSILWIGTLVIMVYWAVEGHSGELFSHGGAVQFPLAYYSVSVFLSAMLTGMICYRLWSHGRRLKERLASEYASPHFAVAALVIESMLPYTLSGIAFLVALGLGSQVMSVFGYAHGVLMCISPQMLILRVATRRAWTRDMNGIPFSGIEFSPQEDVTLGIVSKGSETLYARTLGSTQKGDDNKV